MVDWDLIDDFRSSQSSLSAFGGLDVNQARPDIKDLQFTGLVDLIHSDLSDLRKKIYQKTIKQPTKDNGLARPTFLV